MALRDARPRDLARFGSKAKGAAWRLARRAGSAADRTAFPEGGPAVDHWQRRVLDATVRKHLLSLQPTRLSAAEISGSTHAGLGWRNYQSLDYPQFDLCAPDPQGRFDVVICEQVLEHVVDPWAAARNLRQLCAPGGHVVVTSPFLVKVHELPHYGLKDYWRFTPRGLRQLLEEAGLRVDTVGSWGNRVAVWGNLDRWTGYRKWMPLGNRADTPVQIWAFARHPR